MIDRNLFNTGMGVFFLAGSIISMALVILTIRDAAPTTNIFITMWGSMILATLFLKKDQY